MRAIGYIRVSSEKQAREGLSLAAQESRIRAAAASRGWTITRIIRDGGKTGTHLKRPGVTELLAADTQAIIVWRLDRLTRSVRDLLSITQMLEARKVALVSVTENLDTATPTGRMVITIIAAVAQMEAEQTGLRIKMVKQHLKDEGLRWGTTAPYGYRHQQLGNGKFACVPDADDQRMITLVLDLRVNKGWTLRRIANELQRRKYPTKCGGRWWPQTVARVIANTSTGTAVSLKHQSGWMGDQEGHRNARLKVDPERRKEIAYAGARASKNTRKARKSV